MINDAKLKQRVSILWIIILIGLMFHILLHLTPVFYGINITKQGANGVIPVSMILTYGLSYCIPVMALINAQYLKRRMGKFLNIVLTIFALLVNIGHLSEIFITKAKSPEQLFVLISLFLVAVLLLRNSIKWFQIKL